MTRVQLIDELTNLLSIRKKIDLGISAKDLGTLIGRLREYEHPSDHNIIGKRPERPEHVKSSTYDYRFGMVEYIASNTGIRIAATSTTSLDLIDEIVKRYGL